MQNNIGLKKELAEALGVKIRQIGNYIKRGMPIHSTGKRNVQKFDIEVCKKWKDRNIDKLMSIKTDNSQQRAEKEDTSAKDSGELKGDLARKLKADADSAVIKVQLDDLKLAEAEGRVVDANDLDRSMAEQAVVHKTDKINDENILPIMLANKSATEIKKKLQTHNKKSHEELDKLIHKEFSSKETLYDIVSVVLEQLKNGVEPSSIIKRVKGSLV